ncbi:hypothetical protein GCM10017691_48020 [Pseudonocardia petroleophila]
MGGGGGEVVECGSEVLVRVAEGVAGHDLIVLEHAFDRGWIVAAQGPFGAWLAASNGGLSAILQRGALLPVRCGSSGVKYRMTWWGGRPSPTDVPDPGSGARPGRARRPVVPNRDPHRPDRPRARPVGVLACSRPHHLQDRLPADSACPAHLIRPYSAGGTRRGLSGNASNRGSAFHPPFPAEQRHSPGAPGQLAGRPRKLAG